ncbi:hypothetical protein EJP77_10430 [Paenibacillus zeisoli]|uniref:Uncharacterized protein n=1 Tax=Paenibacillus zeisoli TaxID=2496267 RepID=A0A3S1B5Y8_9BACL|nr:hypothetical protein [Paenibacillus zeisoli]RUT31794.1 hypothetical protein EJP77_10430 [Paenibacillus zeisoli]
MKKQLYKKWWFWLIVLFIIGTFINVTKRDGPKEHDEPLKVATVENVKEDANQEVTPKQTTETQQQTVIEKQQQNNQIENDLIQVTKSGGLGDTKSLIEKSYGNDENEPDSGMSSYRNNSLLVIYYNDIAFNVTLSFEGSGNKKFAEALGEAKTIMPTDAVKVKEYKADENRDVVQYESKALAKQLNSFYNNNEDLKPGTFIVILKHDNKGVYAMIIASGDNP